MLRTKVRHIHLVGIGGIGMSGIAEVLLNLDFQVSGSDLRENPIVRRLQKMGAEISIGHRAENLKGADVLVYTSAASRSNPEVMKARKLGIPVIPRAEMLAELMRMKEGIAVAGTHGKTTSSSLISWVLVEGGMDPTCLIGGRLTSFDSNARLGQGSCLVAEADESDGSFLKLTPVLNVITNVEAEHLDHFGSEAKLNEAFVDFANLVPFYGSNIVCIDDPGIKRLLPFFGRRYITYGMSKDADIQARNVSSKGFHSSFDLYRNKEKVGRFTVNLPGLHNVLNAVSAAAVGMELGIDAEVIKQALSTFAGIDRRFQLKGESKGIIVIDDYGHHPTAIRATLKTTRENFDDRIVAVFQPHRYSRLRDFFDEFATSFENSDMLIVTEVYKANESAIEGISGKSIYEAIKDKGHPDVRYIPECEDVAAKILPELISGDVLITLGAGDVNKIGRRLLDLLNTPVKSGGEDNGC